MEIKDGSFIEGQDIFYSTTIDDIKKSRKMLQPVFEAFTNSLEALSQKADPAIEISLYRNGLIETEPDFDRLIVKDNGTGFNKDSFARFCRFKDNRKGHNNRGSGRIQFLKFFKETNFISRFMEGDICKEIRFSLSKKPEYIKNNAIIYYNSTKTIETTKQIFTQVEFQYPFEEKDKEFYKHLDSLKLKKELIKHYIGYFCKKRDALPKITIKEFVNDKLKCEHNIEGSDIPESDKTDTFVVNYSRYSLALNSVETINDETESFTLCSYKIPKNELQENTGYLTSKDEISQEFDIDVVPKNAIVGGNRFLFLLSSDYIDDLDGNTRGEFEIKTRENIKKNPDECDGSKIIILDDITEKVEKHINKNYPEIIKKKEEFDEGVKELSEMFLLDKDAINKARIRINDTPEKILQKVYKYDADIIAHGDARIKSILDSIDELAPTNENYQEELTEKTNAVVRSIPLQNRTALTHYIARRKLVIDLFDSLLDKEIKATKAKGGHINEDVLHNIFFTQRDQNPFNSDLWLISEEYVHFSGTSEIPLKDLKLDGKNVFREDFSTEEEKYLKSIGKNRLRKRPDVLLFPAEGKCIILEFKAPDTDVSDHLAQITKYATLIHNFTYESFNFNAYYGYLIGEGIENMDVRGADGDFLAANSLGYLYRPNKNIVSFSGKNDGSLYSEVIKYSTLLKRAKLRNKIFIDKLLEFKKTQTEKS